MTYRNYTIFSETESVAYSKIRLGMNFIVYHALSVCEKIINIWLLTGHENVRKTVSLLLMLLYCNDQ
jgi:hypothetical protein